MRLSALTGTNRGMYIGVTMKPRIFVSVVMIAAAVMILAGAHVTADSGTNNFNASLDGLHETPLSLSTKATGSFQARLNPAGDALEYELKYSGLEGGNVLFAHVH